MLVENRGISTTLGHGLLVVLYVLYPYKVLNIDGDVMMQAGRASRRLENLALRWSRLLFALTFSPFCLHCGDVLDLLRV